MLDPGAGAELASARDTASEALAAMTRQALHRAIRRLPAGQRHAIIGASFSPERAPATGLDDLVAFRRLEAMRFAVIRLAVSRDAVDSGGYGHLDRLVAEAERSGQPLVLSVGMTAPGWPEFHVLARLAAAGPGAWRSPVHGCAHRSKRRLPSANRSWPSQRPSERQEQPSPLVRVAHPDVAAPPPCAWGQTGVAAAEATGGGRRMTKLTSQPVRPAATTIPVTGCTSHHVPYTSNREMT